MKKIIIGIICLAVIALITNLLFFRQEREDYSAADPATSEKTADSLDEEGESENMEQNQIQISIDINGTNFKASLENNDTSRELINRLPLNIEMNELNGNEKYYYFNESLPSNSSKIERIEAGDIMLYGNDCLVIFYESFNTSYSYTRIGKIDSPDNLDDAVCTGSIQISITH